MQSLFDSDEEPSSTKVTSSKPRPFKRPPVPSTSGGDLFPQLPLAGESRTGQDSRASLHSDTSQNDPHGAFTEQSPQPPVTSAFIAPVAPPSNDQPYFPTASLSDQRNDTAMETAPNPPPRQQQEPAATSGGSEPSREDQAVQHSRLYPAAAFSQLPPTTTNSNSNNNIFTHHNAMASFLQQPLEPLTTFPITQQLTPNSTVGQSHPNHSNTPLDGAVGHGTASSDLPPPPRGFSSPHQALTMKSLPAFQTPHVPLGDVRLPPMPPVSMPSIAESQSRPVDDTAAWNAFNELRQQLEESHNRTLALHGEISRLQIAHEKEAAALQASVQEQVRQQSRELQEMTENYNSATAKVDHLGGLLARKADEFLRMEQKVHAAELYAVSMAQKVAHVEDRVKLADQARQIAEVRTRELELSLEHATTLIQSLRRQLSVANEDKNGALQEQLRSFEKNREDLIHFYSQREQFLTSSYTESLDNVQKSMQGYLYDRESVMESKWEETYRTQLDLQQSLHAELVKRCESHVEEINALKAAQVKDIEQIRAAVQRENRLSEERWIEREKNLIEDIARRERELSEREQRMRVNLSQAEQEAKVAMLARETEMKAHFDRLLEEMRREYDKDRERLSTAYREQIAAISAQHITNERELERLHREKEREMAQRYRLSNWDMDDVRASESSTTATARTQDILLAKMDKMQADQEARRLAMRTRFSATTPNTNSSSNTRPDDPKS